jgi:hypothetical protein
MKKEVAKASGEPEERYAWISRVETIDDPEELQESEGRQLLDAKVAAGFAKILHGELAKQIQLLEEKAESGKKLLKGRQISWYIKDHFRINADQGAVLDFSDLISVKMQSQYIKRFLHDWESVLLVINKIPNTKILESLLSSQLEKADSLKNLLELYRQDVTQHGQSKDYGRLLQMVKCHLEERRRKKTGMNAAKAVGKGA